MWFSLNLVQQLQQLCFERVHAHWPESPEVYSLVGGGSASWPAAGGAKRAWTGTRGCPKPRSGPHLVKIHQPLHLIKGQTRVKGWACKKIIKKRFNHRSTADGNTSVHGPVLRVVGVWCGASRRIVADYKVDCSLEESNSLLHRLIFKWTPEDSINLLRYSVRFHPAKGRFWMAMISADQRKDLAVGFL